LVTIKTWIAANAGPRSGKECGGHAAGFAELKNCRWNYRGHYFGIIGQITGVLQAPAHFPDQRLWRSLSVSKMT
jgi:hypothetical protein